MSNRHVVSSACGHMGIVHQRPRAAIPISVKQPVRTGPSPPFRYLIDAACLNQTRYDEAIWQRDRPSLGAPFTFRLLVRQMPSQPVRDLSQNHVRPSPREEDMSTHLDLHLHHLPPLSLQGSRGK